MNDFYVEKASSAELLFRDLTRLKLPEPVDKAAVLVATVANRDSTR